MNTATEHDENGAPTQQTAVVVLEGRALQTVTWIVTCVLVVLTAAALTTAAAGAYLYFVESVSITLGLPFLAILMLFPLWGLGRTDTYLRLARYLGTPATVSTTATGITLNGVLRWEWSGILYCTPGGRIHASRSCKRTAFGCTS